MASETALRRFFCGNAEKNNGKPNGLAVTWEMTVILIQLTPCSVGGRLRKSGFPSFLFDDRVHHLREIRLDCGHAFFDDRKTVLRQFRFKGLEIDDSAGSSGDPYGFS